jgi:hypothetical protein
MECGGLDAAFQDIALAMPFILEGVYSDRIDDPGL